MGAKRGACRIRGTLLVCLDWHALIGLAEDPIARKEERNFVDRAYLTTGDVSARWATFRTTSQYPTVH